MTNKEWDNLKKGDLIISASGTIREVILDSIKGLVKVRGSRNLQSRKYGTIIHRGYRKDYKIYAKREAEFPDILVLHNTKKG